jgi:hypothetical protein
MQNRSSILFKTLKFTFDSVGIPGFIVMVSSSTLLIKFTSLFFESKAALGLLKSHSKSS